VHASTDEEKDATSFYKEACVFHQFPTHNINNLIGYLSKNLRKENVFKMTIGNKGFHKNSSNE